MSTFGMTPAQWEEWIAFLETKKPEIVNAMEEMTDAVVDCKPYGEDDGENHVASDFGIFARSVKEQEIAALEKDFATQYNKAEQTDDDFHQTEAKSTAAINTLIEENRHGVTGTGTGMKA